MKVLVTGGTGYLGRAIVRTLAARRVRSAEGADVIDALIRRLSS